MPRIAITRALPEAEASAKRIRALGAEAIVAPLLTISPRPFSTDIAGAQALVFTSLNGVRAFASASAERAIPVFCVGDASAEAAREAGFRHVASADGDIGALAALVSATLTPSAGPLIHVGGAHLAGDLGHALATRGFITGRRIAYEAVAAGTLPNALEQPLDVIAFYSPRAAEIFLALGAPQAERLTAACLSPAVAARAAQVRWTKLVVAPAPREDALFRALGLT